jgi:TolA-binding protein
MASIDGVGPKPVPPPHQATKASSGGSVQDRIKALQNKISVSASIETSGNKIPNATIKTTSMNSDKKVSDLRDRLFPNTTNANKAVSRDGSKSPDSVAGRTETPPRSSAAQKLAQRKPKIKAEVSDGTSKVFDTIVNSKDFGNQTPDSFIAKVCTLKSPERAQFINSMKELMSKDLDSAQNLFNRFEVKAGSSRNFKSIKEECGIR